MLPEVRQIITKLGLVPMPQEGGFFRKTWTAAERFASGRAAASAIYFLITADEFSALHRLAAEELWHFYAGDPVQHVQLDPNSGAVRLNRMGPDFLAGEVPQLRVDRWVWQGARLAPGGTRGWALLGCTLAPAWEEKDFELGVAEAIARDFPAHAALVRELTR